MFKSLKHQRTTKPPAVVLGMKSNGLSVARSLGRHGVTVIGIDQNKNLPGLYSRYCSPIQSPCNGLPDANRQEWLDFLMKIGREFDQLPVLFPCDDPSVLFVSRNRETLDKCYRFLLPSKQVTESLLNKRTTYQLASQLRVPCPNIFALNNEDDLEQVLPKLQFPCALKPVYTHLWRNSVSHTKLAVADSEQELRRLYKQVLTDGLEVIITEIIPGSDEKLYALYTYFNRTGQPLLVMTKRKIRQYPIDYGVGSTHISEWQPEVAELGLRLMQGLDYRGIGIPEFKLDPRDGQYKLMEINVRCGLPIGLAAASGMDIPYLAYQDLIDEPVAAPKHFEEGVKWVCFEWDFFSFLEYRARGKLSWMGWLESLKGKKTYAFFAWDDPIPFLIAMKSFIKQLTHRVWRKFKRSWKGLSRCKVDEVHSKEVL